MAKGYNEIEDLDFIDTFSPVSKLTTIQMLLALASIHNWHLHQLDVNSFLHGDIQEHVYMVIPQGVLCSKSNQVCKFHKSLYGLRQASTKWYEKLTTLLLQNGYKQSNSNHSLFVLSKNGDFIALVVYVDDVMLARNYLFEFTRIKSILDASFKVKDLGKLKYILGLE